MIHEPFVNFCRVSAPRLECVPGTGVRLPVVTVNLAQPGDRVTELCLFFMPSSEGWNQATDMAGWALQQWTRRGLTAKQIYQDLTGEQWCQYQAVMVVLYEGAEDDARSELIAAAEDFIEEFSL